MVLEQPDTHVASALTHAVFIYLLVAAICLCFCPRVPFLTSTRDLLCTPRGGFLKYVEKMKLPMLPAGGLRVFSRPFVSSIYLFFFLCSLIPQLIVAD